jgi:hypothetical protein
MSMLVRIWWPSKNILKNLSDPRILGLSFGCPRTQFSAVLGACDFSIKGGRVKSVLESCVQDEIVVIVGQKFIYKK